MEISPALRLMGQSPGTSIIGKRGSLNPKAYKGMVNGSSSSTGCCCGGMDRDGCA